MKSQFLTIVALSPLAAYALPQHHRKCGSKPTTTVTTGDPLSEITSFTTVPVESLPKKTYSTDYETPPTTIETPTSTITTPLAYSDVTTFSVVPLESLADQTYQDGYVVSTVTTGLPLTEVTSFTVVPVESIPTTSTFLTFTITPTETPTPASSSSAASYVVDGAYAKATPVAYKVKATEQCGNDDRLILPGQPWTVANSMYNADQMVGKQCTNFDSILETADGIKEVKWTSITDIKKVEDTADVCKGYTNVGIGKNLNKKLKDIKSIPAYFQWDRTNTTDFRGSNLFDFITAPTEGDFKSTATSEFMLWVRIWGGQVPIGYSRGPVATFDMFGASWKLYEGKNPANGVTVRSMLVDENYDGVFQGDLKEWLDAMADKGYISSDQYVTVGNAGTEVFYGNAVMKATVALDIN
ncbi:glycoside hydrolase family 12 protein [Xylaria bambusicola]|uniref:glycoside hydrolase family 12 protein n=1 Tax=Xylaria bambusicola TaxID=326684 RepID=UPI002007761B|nr:glycoside hydrolase family 12 protein [Xylaria bambusicola]KAI0509112.1 glycoside hydrolase family 12 protein [Xylaria bambusicola]